MEDKSNESVADNVMESMLGIFNKKAEEVKFVEEQETSKVFFNPNALKANGKVWRGIIKFLPNLQNANSMTVTKIQHWLPEGTSGVMVDSPKSIERYADCPVTNLYYELKNSENAQDKAKSAKIRYYRKTFALVQIIKDLQNPENNGQIMIWNLPVDIQKKINAKMYPTKEDIDMGSVANNIFDPAAGNPMVLKIGIKQVEGEEYRDYTGCDFGNDPITMILNGETELVKLSDKPEELLAQQKAMIETILAGPNLNDYAYKPADEAMVTRIAKSIAAFKGVQLPETSSDNKSQEAEKPAEKVEQKSQEAEKPAPKQAEKQQTAIDEDDDILKTLNLNEN